jgi:hypothetical protein
MLTPVPPPPALEEELKRLSLPVTLQSGFIRELRVHIPWTALTSEPVEVCRPAHIPMVSLALLNHCPQVWINSIEIVASAVERGSAGDDSAQPTEATKKKAEGNVCTHFRFYRLFLLHSNSLAL